MPAVGSGTDFPRPRCRSRRRASRSTRRATSTCP